MVSLIKIVGLGTVVVDNQIYVEKYPAWDTKTDIRKQRMQIGGPVPTALVLLTRWGQSCSFIGKWSDDIHGGLIEKDLSAEGLDITNSVIVKGESSGFADVWVEESTGRRTIATSRGSFPPIQESELDLTLIKEPVTLHLDGWSSAAAIPAAKHVKNLGGTVVLDAGSPKEGYADLLPLVDVVLCPKRFAKQYFADGPSAAATKLQGMGVSTVVFTEGENDIELFQNDLHLKQPAYKIKALDTTGAGDVFCAGYLYAMTQKMTPEEALKFAAAAAALKCTKIGNRDALPSVVDVKRLVMSNE